MEPFDYKVLVLCDASYHCFLSRQVGGADIADRNSLLSNISKTSSPFPISPSIGFVLNIATFSSEPHFDSEMSSISLDESTDAMPSGPVLRSKTLARRRGTKSIRATQKFATRQTRVITDESPSSHFNFMKMPYDVRREVYLLLMGNRDIYITTVFSVLGYRLVRVAQETNIKDFLELSPTYSFPTDVPTGSTGLARLLRTARASLRILRVSRQIYDEAHLLPYMHNKFHMNVQNLEDFMDCRNSPQKQSLRSLSVRVDGSRSGTLYLMNLKYAMLRISCLLAGLRDLNFFIDISWMDAQGDIMHWIEILKIWGTRRLVLTAEVVVNSPSPNTIFSELKRQQMKDMARKVSAELSDRHMVEEHRKIATKIFNELPEDLRRMLIKSFDKFKAERIGRWLPEYPETVD
jgi:hypothetical protein